MSVNSRAGGAIAVARPVTSDEWAVLRDIRLEALSLAPDAFGSTYAREAAFTEQDWRRRISDRSITLFGYSGVPGDAVPAGLAGVFVDEGDADLVSMYVRPSGRGTGVGVALIDAAAAWARDQGHGALCLWVTESNQPALRLYERYGFTPTGDHQPLPSNPSLSELRMSFAL
jgi:GNAT superfamily N-acetyltransferase